MQDRVLSFELETKKMSCHGSLFVSQDAAGENLAVTVYGWIPRTFAPSEERARFDVNFVNLLGCPAEVLENFFAKIQKLIIGSR